MAEHEHEHIHIGDAVEDTVRIEAFSDGIYAIVITLLIFTINVPSITAATNNSLLHALKELLPQFIAFIFSFFVVAIYWVNHHYFFHSVKKTDWKLLWYNNFHLFWITTIPFTTSFIGRYYYATIPVLVYGLDMVMAAFSIMAMIGYVFFKSDLMYKGFSEPRKKSEFKRGMMGVYLYLASCVAALINVYLALAVFIAVPILFVIPRLLPHQETE